MLLCDISAYDSRLANVRSVVSRSSNKLLSERVFTVSQGAGAGTCYWNTGTFFFFTFHLGSEQKVNQKLFQLCRKYRKE